MPRNEIIIDGVRHILKTSAYGFYPCRYCSLQNKCEDNPICQHLFGRMGMFETYKKKEK